LTVFAFLAVTAVAQTTTQEKIQGTATVTEKKLSGTVVSVDGNTLVARLSTGEFKMFTPPASTKFMIDGKETQVRDLVPGTTLHATMVTTTTPITQRTVTTVSGTVWFVSGNTVILAQSDGVNKMYKPKPGVKFDIGGNKKASVFELRKGMHVSAEKVVEEPLTEVASNTVVTGSAPKPKEMVAAPVAAAPAPAPEAAPAPAPAPAPAQAAAAPEPATLPKTGSPIPLAGMLGLLFTGAGLGLRMLRRS